MRIRKALIDEMIDFRRWMHMHPELSEAEQGTEKRLHEILDEKGIEHICGVAGHGIVAIVRGGKPGPTVAAKADIDALPIREKSDVPFASTCEGVMHACGHDANTAILLGTAVALKEMEAEIAGNVKFFFEPAEETIGGGELMVREGCMRDPDVSAMIGLHVMPHIDTGKIEIKRGCLNAGSNEVEITVHGVSGHAAEPETCVDPIVVTAYIITALQTFVSRNTAPTDAAVLTFGLLKSGTKGNIIPETAFLKGTLRTLYPAQRNYAKTRVREIAESVAHALGARADVHISDSYDPLINDDDLVELIMEEASALYGKDAIVIKDVPSMGAEDFSYYTKTARGAYFHVGCKPPEQGEIFGLHTDKFYLDENAIKNGIEIQTAVLLRMLKEEALHRKGEDTYV